MSRIAEVRVIKVEKPASDGSAIPKYAPTVFLRDEAAGERVVEWYDQTKALAFAEWLSWKLRVGTISAER